MGDNPGRQASRRYSVGKVDVTHAVAVAVPRRSLVLRPLAANAIIGVLGGVVIAAAMYPSEGGGVALVGGVCIFLICLSIGVVRGVLWLLWPGLNYLYSSEDFLLVKKGVVSRSVRWSDVEKITLTAGADGNEWSQSAEFSSIKIHVRGRRNAKLTFLAGHDRNLARTRTMLRRECRKHSVPLEGRGIWIDRVED